MENKAKVVTDLQNAEWHKCELCHRFFPGRNKLLLHISTNHRKPKPQLFYINGIGLRIQELPNNYDMFKPQIRIRSFGSICQRSKFQLKPCKVQVEKLSEAKIENILNAMSKMKLRVRTKRPAYDLIAEGVHDPEDLNWEPSNDLNGDEMDIEFNPPPPPLRKNRRDRSRQGQTGNSVTRTRRILGQKIKDGYVCKYCDKKFDFEYRHILHVKLHEARNARNATKPFQCSKCPERFTQKYNLKRHFMKHMENNPFVCEFPGCGHRSTTAENLTNHIRRHFAENVVCSLCSREFAKQKSLDAHMLRIHPNGKTIVPKRKERTTGPVYRTKRAVAHGIAPEDLCLPALRSLGIEVENREQERVELESVHLGDTETVKAEGAQALADVKEELEHLNIDPSDRSEATPLNTGASDDNSESSSEDEASDKGSTNKRNPRSYLVNLYAADPVVQSLAKEKPEFAKLLIAEDGNGSHTTGGNHGAFPCKICVYPKVSYPRIRFLKEHMLKHHPEAAETETPATLTFACDRCGFQCDTTKKLTRHYKTHGTVRKFRCPDCGYNFTTEIRLNAHIQRIHMQKRNFKCDQCTKAFLKDFDLSKHKQRVHVVVDIESSPFVCKVCGKKTKGEAYLKSHMRLHDKNRVFSYCKICNEKLSNATSLRRHIQLIHVNPAPFLLPLPERKEENPSQSNIFL